MTNPFTSGWRAGVHVADLGTAADGMRLGVIVQMPMRGVLYTLQRDWKWASCPLGMTFPDAHHAFAALANVDPPTPKEAQ